MPNLDLSILKIMYGDIPVKKIMQGDNVVWQGSHSASDYIQDGLVAMWDGIENIGWEQHSDSATTWVNLKGNTDYDFSLQNVSWTSDGLITSSDYSLVGESISSIPYEQNLTTEVVFEIYAINTTSARLIFFKLGTTITSGGNEHYMRMLAFNKNNNLIGWMFKSNSIMTNSGYNTPPLDTPLSIAVVYTVPSGTTNNKLSQAPTRVLIDNQQKTPTWKSEGAATGRTGMFISGMYGKVHSIRVYNRQLTNTELGKNYAIDKKRFRI